MLTGQEMNQTSFIMYDKYLIHRLYINMSYFYKNVIDMHMERLEIISFLTYKAKYVEKQWIISTNIPVSAW